MFEIHLHESENAVIGNNRQITCNISLKDVYKAYRCCTVVWQYLYVYAQNNMLKRRIVRKNLIKISVSKVILDELSIE